MNYYSQKIKNAITNGYQFEIGNVLNTGFDTFKKTFLYGALALFLMSIVILLFSGGTFIAFDLTTKLQELITDVNFMTDFQQSTPYIAIQLSAILIFSLFAPLTAGIIYINHKAYLNQDISFNDVFSLYRSKKFLDLFLASVLLGIIGIAFEYLSNQFNHQLIITIGISLVSSFFSILTFLATPIIIFTDESFVSAIGKSINLVIRKPFHFIIVGIVGGLIAIIGVLGCIIGLFFTIPIFYSFIYASFIEITDIEQESEINQIGQDGNDNEFQYNQ